MRSVVLALGLMLAAAPAVAFEIEEQRMFAGTPGGPVLRVISTTDTEIFAPLLLAFQQSSPAISIDYVVTSTQELFSAIAEDQAAFDLAVSSAMDLQMKLANDGFATSHRSPATAALPGWAHWQDQLYAFSQEPVVLTFSRRGLAGLPVPRTREDLIRILRDHPERFEGRIGTYDPDKSGAGYLFATQDARQSDTFWRLSEVLGRLDPVLYTASGAMIEDLKQGRLVMAYNLLGSYVAARMPEWEDGAIVELQDFTHVLLRTAIVPISAEEPDLGRTFLDFLLSAEGQKVLGEQTGLPPIDEAALSSQPHLRPIRLDPGLLVFVDPLKRRKFLNEWTAAIVQP